MIRPICTDVKFLRKKSEPATEADLPIAKDLQDTLKANRERCVGMAANMIGVRKNIIVISIGFLNVVMFNPVITKKEGLFHTEEGCLSLKGTRPTDRYEEIELEFRDMNWKKQKQTFKGWTAQIIQHECDHLEGRII